MSGRTLVAGSWAGTALFAVAALPRAAGAEATGYAAVVVPLALFAASIPLSLYALARGALRTARGGERVTVSGLFFLRGSAPAPVRRLLLGSLAVSVGVAAAAAPAVPFGILVPVYPLALTGVWAARHGTFAALPEPAPRRAAGGPTTGGDAPP